MLGASLGQALTSGNPITLIGIAIAGAMKIGGLSIGALLGAYRDGQGAAKEYLLDQAKAIPEAVLTGFCIGLLIGSIQRAIKSSSRVTTQEEPKSCADQFVKDNKLPQYTKIFVDPSGKIHIDWSQPDAFRPTNLPKFSGPFQNIVSSVLRCVRVEISPHSQILNFIDYEYYDSHYWHSQPLSNYRINATPYPCPATVTNASIAPLMSTEQVLGEVLTSSLSDRADN